MRVVDLGVSRLVRLICCRIILTAIKQSRETVDLPLTFHPSSSLTTFAFRLREVRRLMLDLNLMVALTHWVFTLFLERTPDVIAPPPI